MEKNAILKVIKSLGWKFEKQGGSHEIWRNANSKTYLAIPRSKRVNKGMAKALLIQAKKFLEVS